MPTPSIPADRIGACRDLWYEVRGENETASLLLDLAESEGKARHLRDALTALNAASTLLECLIVVAEADLSGEVTP